MASVTEKKKKTVRINGCVASAQAAKYADVDVIAAYPIRPYTATMMALAQMVANGELDAEFRFSGDAGTPRWLNLRGQAIERAADGTSTRISGVVFDVTGRKRLEEERKTASGATDMECRIWSARYTACAISLPWSSRTRSNLSGWKALRLKLTK